MNFKKIKETKITRVINDLADRGARVKVVFDQFPNFIIDAKWSTGRHWQIVEIT